ncbi:MAG: L-threonylcarbamoyladenylate synthase, partial [Gemmatimonadota bacterium]|nr:L-threonylcarbamoyladenylate synthase [Gemmatimonadota bacterium]
MLIEVDHQSPDPVIVEEVGRVLLGGGVVALRTDTVYGFVGSVNRPDAIRKLIRLKKRPKTKPFIVLASDWQGVRAVTGHLPAVARSLGDRFWPGPLTMVLPADHGLPKEVTAGGRTIAVRIPDNAFVTALLEIVGAPLAAPSANVAGAPPAVCGKDIHQTYGDRVDLVLDGGEGTGRKASTIVDCTTDPAEILRPGVVA